MEAKADGTATRDFFPKSDDWVESGEKVARFPAKVSPDMESVHAEHTETGSGPKKERRETSYQNSDKHGHSGE
jgi:hypothetical protein